MAKNICVYLFTMNGFCKAEDNQKLIKKEFGKDARSVKEVRSIIIEHANQIKLIIRKELADGLKKGLAITLSFDEWSCGSTQMMNIIIHQGKRSYNIGLIEILNSSTAENLYKAIQDRIELYGIKIEQIKMLIGDGAAVNSKIARISNIMIQQCMNHAIQLAIVDTFYQKKITPEYNSSSESEQIDEEDDDDQEMSVEDDHDQEMSVEDDNDQEMSVEDDGTNEEADFALNMSPVRICESFNAEIMPLITNVRQLAKKFRTPKCAKALKKYTTLKMKLDVVTRWTSLSEMIGRFIRLHNELQKACIDLKMSFPISETELNILKSVNDVVNCATLIIKKLSEEKSNLSTADHIVARETQKIDQSSIPLMRKFSKNLVNRFLARRTIASDVLAYLISGQVDQSNNPFYEKPSYEQVKTVVEIFCPEILIQTLQHPSNRDDLVENTMNIDLDCIRKCSGDLRTMMSDFERTGMLGNLKSLAVN